MRTGKASLLTKLYSPITFVKSRNRKKSIYVKKNKSRSRLTKGQARTGKASLLAKLSSPVAFVKSRNEMTKINR